MTVAVIPILELLATRDALDDERLHVPRTLIMGGLQGLGVTLKSVWLWGPRRVGKSTIASRLLRAAATRGCQTCRVDASEVRSFDALVGRILDGVEPDGDRRTDNGLAVRDRLDRLAASGSGRPPILIAIDEADGLAVTLDQGEQNFLRSRAENGRLRYVFVSHLNPADVVEETPDVASRLLGITISKRVGLLGLEDVEKLFSQVEQLLGIDGFSDLADRVWGEVGGHALSVMTLAHALAVSGRVDADSVADVLDRTRAELLQQMGMLWGDLSPGTRTLFEDDTVTGDNYCRSEASSEGLYSRRDGIIRPRLLGEARRGPLATRRAGSSNGECWNALFEVYELILEINTTTKAKFGRGWFEATDERLRGRLAAKVSASESDLSDVVNHLSKIAYEAAREPDPAKETPDDPMKWRIPPPYAQTFSGSQSIKSIRTLRNFFGHDPDVRRPIDKKADRYLEAGRVFRRLCDTERPHTPAQWSRVHRGLLAELAEALDTVLAHVRKGGD